MWTLTPFSNSESINLIPADALLENLSNFVTTKVSPSFKSSNNLVNSGLSVFNPL